MPTIGHAIFPFLTFRGQKLGLYGWAVLVFFSLLPDADVILGFLMTGSIWGFHRMLTHSFLFLLIFLAGFIFIRRIEAALAFIGVSSHLLLDLLDTHGLPLLWPFSQQYFALGLWLSSDIRNVNPAGVMNPANFIPDKILVALLILWLTYYFGSRWYNDSFKRRR